MIRETLAIIMGPTRGFQEKGHFLLFHFKFNPASEGGGAITSRPEKGCLGMPGGQDPRFTPLPPFFRSPVAALFSS